MDSLLASEISIFIKLSIKVEIRIFSFANSKRIRTFTCYYLCQDYIPDWLFLKTVIRTLWFIMVDLKVLILFLIGNIVTGSHNHKPPTHRGKDLNIRRTGCQAKLNEVV